MFFCTSKKARTGNQVKSSAAQGALHVGLGQGDQAAYVEPRLLPSGAGARTQSRCSLNTATAPDRLPWSTEAARPPRYGVPRPGEDMHRILATLTGASFGWPGALPVPGWGTRSVPGCLLAWLIAPEPSGFGWNGC